MKRRKLSFLFIFLFLLAALPIMTASANTNSKRENNMHIDFHHSIEESYLSFTTEKYQFTNDEEISVSYLIVPGEEIVDICYTQTGFEVLDVNVDENDSSRLNVMLACLPYSDSSDFRAMITTSNSKTFTATLYSINTEYGVFVSPFSIEHANRRFENYAIANGIVNVKPTCTLEEWLVINSNNSSNLTLNLNNTSTSYETNALSDTNVKGVLSWIDDNGISHELRKVKVELYARTVLMDVKIGEAMSLNDGSYSIDKNVLAGVLFNNNSLLLYIKVYAGDDNVVVMDDDGIAYFAESEIETTSLSQWNSSDIDIDLSVVMTNNIEGQALQISQAAITARDYAQEMIRTLPGYSVNFIPNMIPIYYPIGDKCEYNDDTISGTGMAIFITGKTAESGRPNVYASWDVIMHEYGHHIQNHVDIINSPGGSHSINTNLSFARGNKEEGIRLAWAEAWPTVFGMMAQSYYSEYMDDIISTNNTNYDAYNLKNTYDIENCNVKLGDGCELSIMAVLWDLFDSNSTNDAGRDTISLGHEPFWSITTGGKPKTFSDFIADFYVSYPQYIDNIGANLSHYQMATTVPALDTSVTPSQTTPPKFKWDAQGESSGYPNDRFELIVFDKRGDEILRSEILSTDNYTLTAEQWQQILYSYGTTYTVAVSATQSGSPKAGYTFPIGPETGKYISGYATFTKPLAAPMSSTITFAAGTRLIEKTETLQPSQYADYKITFPADGKKIVQTFGTSDTYITVYDSTGSIVASNDDSGYVRNAFVSYNFKKNQEYTIRVRMYFENESGSYKLSVTPASMVKDSSATSISTYDDIYSLSGTDDIEASTTLYPYNTVVYVFTPSESGNYTFTIDSDYDTYIYVDDPRSTTSASRNDDSGEELNPLLTKYLEAGIPYYIVCSAYDPGDSMQPIPITLQIYKNNS